MFMFSMTCDLVSNSLLLFHSVATDTPDSVSKELVEAELVDGRDRVVGALGISLRCWLALYRPAKLRLFNIILMLN